MKIVSAEQMRALDRLCIEELGIPSLVLMARAGEAVAETAFELLYEQPGPVVVLCGKGNNGGDGMAAARLLDEAGHDVHVILPFSEESLSPDALAVYRQVKADGILIEPQVSDEELRSAALVIDALLGTGVTGPVTGVMGSLISRTNARRGGKGVLAVDLPSGVETDTGKILGPTIFAEVTVTLALPKPCLVLYPGAQQAGRWTVADIGIPAEAIEMSPCVAEVTERAQAVSWMPRRSPTAHKHSVGWALIVAGSFGMTGAAAMAATSAYRSGVGLVRLALPASLVPALNAVLTEVVFRPVPETRAGTLSFQAVKPLIAEASAMQAALIGPGLSHNAATQNAIRRFVAQWPGPLVVDADALTAMVGADELWGQRNAPTIITPHPGEMSYLLSKTVPELEEDRIATAKEAAKRFNAIVVFKGTPTVIAAPDGETFVNPTGNAGLAVAGTGDCLAGSIVALLAQGLPALHAAALATYAGGLAAEMLSDSIGIMGMTALDLIDGLPYALKELAR
ncbi:MAG TPA: NAD(P)H-hydrate dehydratase [Armatimonadota bacterium]